MKVRFPLFFIAVFIFNFAQAQATADASGVSVLSINDMRPESPEEASAGRLVDPWRFHKKLPAFYSGYAIEIASSFRPLERDFHLFKHFGNVHYLKNRDGRYSYMILVDFAKSKSVVEYMDNMVSPHVQNPTALQFKRGESKMIRKKR